MNRLWNRFAIKGLPMAFIQTVPPAESTGLLKKIYDTAISRAGKVYNVLRIQSINPQALQGSMSMYAALMHGPSPLSRAQREMIATVVSRTNDCHY